MQKERIVYESMKMFVDQGIKSVRMDDIAAKLGVSKRTLYELFGDKEGLLWLAMNCYFDKRIERQAELAAGAKNMLEAIFIILNDVMDESENVSRLMANLRKFYPSVYARLFRERDERNRKGLHEYLEKGVADGLFVKDINIELALSLLYHTAAALIFMRELTPPKGMTEREAFLQIMTTFFRGISTPRGVALIDEYRSAHASGGLSKE